MALTNSQMLLIRSSRERYESQWAVVCCSEDKTQKNAGFDTFDLLVYNIRRNSMEILILILGYIPAILYYLMGCKNNMSWSFESITQIFIPVASIILSVYVSTRSGNGKTASAKSELSKEHTALESKLSKEHTALGGKMSNEHLELKSELKADIVQTQHSISTAQNCIAGKIDILDRVINNEIIRRSNLSPDQSKINTAVDIIKVGWDNLIRENQELRQQVFNLQQENAALKNELHNFSDDNSESDEWEQ